MAKSATMLDISSEYLLRALLADEPERFSYSVGKVIHGQNILPLHSLGVNMGLASALKMEIFGERREAFFGSKTATFQPFLADFLSCQSRLL